MDRCREIVFRLALVRPDITFTLFDKGRKSFLLRLLKVSRKLAAKLWGDSGRVQHAHAGFTLRLHATFWPPMA